MSVKKRKFHMWCDDDDYALLAHYAGKAGMSKSEFMRNLLYHGGAERHVNYTREDANMLLAELCSIANSMAYISYSARLKRCVDEGDFRELESNFKSLVKSFGEHIIG